MKWSTSMTNLNKSRNNVCLFRLCFAWRRTSSSDKINHLMWVELNARLACHWLAVNLQCLWRCVVSNFAAHKAITTITADTGMMTTTTMTTTTITITTSTFNSVSAAYFSRVTLGPVMFPKLSQVQL